MIYHTINELHTNFEIIPQSYRTDNHDHNGLIRQSYRTNNHDHNGLIQKTCWNVKASIHKNMERSQQLQGEEVTRPLDKLQLTMVGIGIAHRQELLGCYAHYNEIPGVQNMHKYSVIEDICQLWSINRSKIPLNSDFHHIFHWYPRKCRNPTLLYFESPSLRKYDR